MAKDDHKLGKFHDLKPFDYESLYRMTLDENNELKRKINDLIADRERYIENQVRERQLQFNRELLIDELLSYKTSIELLINDMKNRW